MIRFHCPKCEAEMEVDESFAGRGARCPTCGTNLKVPRKGEAPPPPAAKASQPRPGSATVKVDGQQVEIVPPMETMVYMSLGFLIGSVISIIIVWGGIFSFTRPLTLAGGLGSMLGVLGLLTALLSCHSIRRSRGRKVGARLALSCLVAGGGLVLLSFVLLIFGIATEWLGRSSCEDNLKHIYAALRGFTSKHEDALPRELRGLVEERFLDSSSWLTCKEYPDAIGRQTYSYWGTDASRLGVKITQLPPELPIVTDGPPYDLHPDKQVRVLTLKGDMQLIPIEKWELYKKAQGEKWNEILNKICNPKAAKPPEPAPPPKEGESTEPAPKEPAPGPATPAPGPAAPAPAPVTPTPAPAAGGAK
jgi:DNA-directed RNA polymerase subunit RPC12/RpoP